MAKTKHIGPLAAAAGALVAVALLVLMLVVVNPQPAKAAFPGQNGRIAFSSDRDGDYEIYTVRSTGTEVDLVQRTFDPAWDQEPAYSPDGSKIAFRSNRSGDYDIWTVNSTAPPNLTQITNKPATDEEPAYSPNGSRIAFASDRSSNIEIYTVSSTGTEVGLNPITNDLNISYSPDWQRRGGDNTLKGLGGNDELIAGPGR